MLRFAISFLIFLSGTGSVEVLGQTYPNRPLRIVAAGIGGGGDFTARQIAQGLTASLDQRVIVDNRPGSGVIGAELVAKAPPDGHTLIVGSSTLWLSQFLQEVVPFDPIKDFASITLAATQANILVVHPSIAASSVKEFIALAKAKPGELNYGTNGTGTSTHLAAELFAAMAGVNIVRVNYKANPQSFADLLGGQIQVMFAVGSAVMTHVNAGKLRALAVSTAKPSVIAPGLPTISAAGLPGYESASVNALFAPANTPRVIINRLNQETVRILHTPDVRDRFLKSGVEPIGSTPEELSSKIKSEMARMGKVIKDAGIKAE